MFDSLVTNRRLDGSFTKHVVSKRPSPASGYSNKIVAFDSFGFLKIMPASTQNKKLSEEEEEEEIKQENSNDEIIYKFNSDVVKENKIIEYNGEYLIAFVNNEGSTLKIMDIKSKNMVELVSKNLENEFASPIKELQWHPLSVSKTLVVLLENSDLFQYNVLTSEVFHMNNETFNFKSELCNVESHFNYKDMSQYDFLGNLSSFTFGKNGLKLYLSESEENDVYCIYPFFPYFEDSVTMDSLLVTELFNESYILYQENLNKEGCTANDMRTLIKQMKFASEHLYLDTTTKKDDFPIKKQKNVTVEIPFNYRTEYGIQGPFQIAPYSPKLYSLSLVKMSSVDISNGNEVLCLIFNDQSLFMCFDDLAIPMFWSSIDLETSSSLISSFNCSLVGLEFISSTSFLSLHEIGYPVSTVIDSIPHKLIFLNENHNRPFCYVFDFSPWSLKLSDCIADSNDLMDFHSIKSDVTIQEGATSCTYADSLNKFVFIDSENALITKDIGGKSTQSKNNDAFSQKFLNKFVLSNKPKQYAVQHEHKAYMGNDIKELNLLHRDMKMMENTSLYGKDSIVEDHQKFTPLSEIDDLQDEDIYMVLNELSDEMKKKIAYLNSFGYKIHTILQKQSHELKKQVIAGNDLLKSTTKIEETKQSQTQRFSKLLEKSENHKQRFQDLKKKLDENIEETSKRLSNGSISGSEKSWFMDLKKKILQFNTIVLQQQKYNDQLEYLKTTSLNKTQQRALSPAPEEDPFSFKELQDLLKVDKSIIDGCNDELLVVARELESKLNS